MCVKHMLNVYKLRNGSHSVVACRRKKRWFPMTYVRVKDLLQGFWMCDLKHLAETGCRRSGLSAVTLGAGVRVPTARTGKHTSVTGIDSPPAHRSVPAPPSGRSTLRPARSFGTGRFVTQPIEGRTRLRCLAVPGYLRPHRPTPIDMSMSYLASCRLP